MGKFQIRRKAISRYPFKGATVQNNISAAALTATAQAVQDVSVPVF
ncbi:MAG: hypothetical protein GY874_16685 [Desulfobacteraceae bacterium]|nr:hypothetical protein [Desulfobacteraceae bacterium]